MALGKVVRFDDVRGYGFIVPDDGGEDIFMHANDLQDDKSLYRPGAVVEFELGHGERGPKASVVSVVEAAPGRSGGAQPGYVGEDEDVLCDVLSTREFRQELTEALLESAPTLTGAQILQVRQAVGRLARDHHWLAN
ncbi:cold shock domain-containing protein [Streptomyces sp. JJ66]|uniref:cold-shock protein n=1 Tax=Streptomyces sp. JJ66 TaxID=2803843 RepID=UPI001C57C0AD|nr:cold shock domain-containing protein [Streptomyces sp. JJ66]MBW1601371.1 cold shock domain-containing protein [Streptomyces sp. JJ66]